MLNKNIHFNDNSLGVTSELLIVDTWCSYCDIAVSCVTARYFMVAQ